MFYETAFIESLLKCNQCTITFSNYEEPRMIPCCSQTICQECVSKIELVAGKYTCLACKKVNVTIPDTGFPVNKLAVLLKEGQPKEVYRSEHCEKLKSCLVGLQKACELLTFEMQNYDSTILEQCNETRRRVQLAYDEKIQEMNDFHESLIQKISEYERKCLENSVKINIQNTRRSKDLIEQVNDFIEKQKTYISQVKIEDNQIADSIQKLNELKDDIEHERLCVKKAIFTEGLIEFEPDIDPLSEEIIGRIVPLSIDPIKTELLSSYGDKTIKQWDLTNSKCLDIYRDLSEKVHCIETVNNNKIVYISNKKKIESWNMSTDKYVKKYRGHADSINCVQFLTDGKNGKLISCSSDRTIRIWDKETEQLLETFLTPKELLGFKVISASRIVAYSCSSVELWNLKSASCSKTFEGHGEFINSVEILTNNRIASCSNDKTVKVWSIRTGNCLATLKGHSKGVNCVKYVANNKIISCSHDKKIKVWDLKSNSCIMTLKGHRKAVTCLDLVSSSRIASASTDGVIKIWDLETGDCIQTFEFEDDLSEMSQTEDDDEEEKSVNIISDDDYDDEESLANNTFEYNEAMEEEETEIISLHAF